MQSILQLPPELINFLLVIPLTFLITEGLKSLSALLGRDLTGAAAFIVAGLVAAVMAFINALLASIPPAQEPIWTAVFQLIVLLLGAAGLHKTIKRFEARVAKTTYLAGTG